MAIDEEEDLTTYSPSWDFKTLQKIGASLVNDSTPYLLGAQTRMKQTLRFLKEHDGLLPNDLELPFQASLGSCAFFLQANLNRRGKR